MSIANYFTFVRLIISPIFMLVYLQHQALGINDVVLPYVLLALLTISELSDAVDGYIARLYNQVTDFGKVLDPMADSIARTSLFLTFTVEPVHLPVPLVFIFLYRDSIVSTLRTICALKGFALAARISGKVKAVIQAVAGFVILFLMIPHSMGLLSSHALQSTAAIVTTIAAVYTIFSGIDYIISNWFYISKLLWLQQSRESGSKTHDK